MATRHPELGQALVAMAQGDMVILVDDVCREHEADICMAAQFVTAESIAWMAHFARGLICLTLTPEQGQRLALEPMVQHNSSTLRTAFTCSIEARHGVTTGISAQDRARTVQAAIHPQAQPDDLVRPGHMFPLIAQPAGLLQRFGHTEASVDLARMAGCQPAAVICEMMAPDGTMVRGDGLQAFARTHQLPVLTLSVLLEQRLTTESWLCYDGPLHPTPLLQGNKSIDLHAFHHRDTGDEWLLVDIQPHGPGESLPQLTMYHAPPLCAALALAHPSPDFICQEKSLRQADRHRTLQLWLPEPGPARTTLARWLATRGQQAAALPMLGTCQGVVWLQQVVQSLRHIGVEQISWQGPTAYQQALQAAGLKVHTVAPLHPQRQPTPQECMS